MQIFPFRYRYSDIAQKFAAIKKTAAEITAERERVRAGLETISGLRVYPSQANFLLVRQLRGNISLYSALKQRGILIRDVSGGQRLAACYRITIGTPAENNLLLTSVKEVMADTAGGPNDTEQA